MATQYKNEKQQEITNELISKFGIDADDVLFLNNQKPYEPWIAPESLIAIARKHGGFKVISSLHDKYVPERQQVVYTGTVVNAQEQSFITSGVATVGETPNGVEIDADVLAKGRAASAALRDAGFDPTRSGSLIELGSYQPKQAKQPDRELTQIQTGAEVRRRDLARIHALAEERNLIVTGYDEDLKPKRDDTRYRRWLYDNFRDFFRSPALNSPEFATAAVLTADERGQVINKLANYNPEEAEIEELKKVA